MGKSAAASDAAAGLFLAIVAAFCDNEFDIGVVSVSIVFDEIADSLCSLSRNDVSLKKCSTVGLDGEFVLLVHQVSGVEYLHIVGRSECVATCSVAACKLSQQI